MPDDPLPALVTHLRTLAAIVASVREQTIAAALRPGIPRRVTLDTISVARLLAATEAGAALAAAIPAAVDHLDVGPASPPCARHAALAAALAAWEEATRVAWKEATRA